MGAVNVLGFCCFLITMADAGRRSVKAGGIIVDEPEVFPWMVRVNPYFEGVNTTRTVRDTDRACTGSFIDIYGSVLTAAHCVRTHYRDLEKDLGPWSVKLEKVYVDWGYSVTTGRFEHHEFIDLSRIRRYETSNKLQGKEVDIALLNVESFEKRPMSCKEGSVPQPVKLSKRGILFTGKPKDGLFVGYREQFLQEGNLRKQLHLSVLMEMKMHVGFYRAPIPKSRFLPKPRSHTNPRLFRAYGDPEEDTSYIMAYQFKRWARCEGDDGGPYMVNDTGVLKQRGVLIGQTHERDWFCVKINTESTFADVTHKDVRNWIEKQLKEKYNQLKEKYNQAEQEYNQAKEKYNQAEQEYNQAKEKYKKPQRQPQRQRQRQRQGQRQRKRRPRSRARVPATCE